MTNSWSNLKQTPSCLRNHRLECQVRKCVCQKFLAFQLSLYLDIVRLLTVKNLPKIIPTFDGKNFCKTRNETTKNFETFENVENIREFLTFVLGIRIKILEICLKKPQISGRKFQKVYQKFWTFWLSTWFLAFWLMLKMYGKLRTFYFATGDTFSQNCTKFLNCYPNAQP